MAQKSEKIQGVKVEIITPKEGQENHFPKKGQKVKVHYTGYLPDNTKFDSSLDRGKPFQFTIGREEVIKGWDVGILQVSIGAKARLTCSPDYAYGQRGHPGVIPPNSILIFDVELLSVE